MYGCWKVAAPAAVIAVASGGRLGFIPDPLRLLLGIGFCRRGTAAVKSASVAKPEAGVKFSATVAVPEPKNHTESWERCDLGCI